MCMKFVCLTCIMPEKWDRFFPHGYEPRGSLCRVRMRSLVLTRKSLKLGLKVTSPQFLTKWFMNHPTERSPHLWPYWNEKTNKQTTNEYEAAYYPAHESDRKIPDDLSITLLSKEITSSKPAKNLGVAMDCNLTYDEHVIQLTSKCIGSSLY